MKRLILGAIALVLLVAEPAQALSIPHRYARTHIRRLIERDYYVNRGPYIDNCRGSAHYVKCDVEFRAGIYWHCGYGSAKLKGGYVYIRLRAPIGC